jgi:hypothetical protein
MNPFDIGVVSAIGLHGVMTRHIAQRGRRIVQGQEYNFFYNPMWAFFGDGTAGPAGTYYYQNAEHKVFFWNVFDQVLIRPTLLPCFDNSDLKILDSDGENQFLSVNGTPNDDLYSDHLPITFSIKP